MQPWFVWLWIFAVFAIAIVIVVRQFISGGGNTSRGSVAWRGGSCLGRRLGHNDFRLRLVHWG